MAPVDIFRVFVVTFRSASDVIRPIANIPGLVPHEAGRTNAFLHDAFEALPIGGAVGVKVEISAGAIQPFLVIRRQLTTRRRQNRQNWHLHGEREGGLWKVDVR